MNLIEKLDQAYSRNPDPDSIAGDLYLRGWIKISDLTQEFYRKNREEVCVIGVARAGNFRIIATYWTMGGYADTAVRVRNGLRSANYFIILKDEYEAGMTPL